MRRFMHAVVMGALPEALLRGEGSRLSGKCAERENVIHDPIPVRQGRPTPRLRLRSFKAMADRLRVLCE